MNEKKKILIFIDWFLPGYKAGGPIRSVANIIEHLADVFEFYIVTSDRDFSSETPYKIIEFNKFIQKDNFKIIYLSPENQNNKNFAKIVSEQSFDIVYFNSLFSIKFTLLPLRIIKKRKENAKIILAPRGMLGKGALHLKKTKKQIFLIASKFLGLFKNITWHATDEVEVEDIKKYFGNQSQIVLVSNISEKIQLYKKIKKDITKFVFLSRIAEKKNLLFALKVFQNIKTKKDVVFSIYGTNEDEDYFEKCKIATKNLSKNKIIEFKGAVPHEKVNKILSQNHFYILPTLHENFGHSIFEAMSAGCPVIISDQTPWRNLEEKNIGWDIALNDEAKFTEVIQQCIDMPDEEYQKMSQKTYKFAENITNDKSVIEKTRKMFADE